MDVQEELQAEILERVQQRRALDLTCGGSTKLLVFTVGGYV